MKLYPLQFKPILKDKIWGGNRLNDIKRESPPISNLGESWEISVVPENESIVQNGYYAGQSLVELIEDYPDKLLGNTVLDRFGSQFPLLIKYINAAQDLSIQVHPDDTVAQEKHNSFGKTEMWYIMDAEPDARLILGFNEDCDKDAFAKAISENTVMELLNSQKVTAGDSFFIHPGFIHAIGAGVTLAEIQQSSDITYRVYDFDRKDVEGNTRELHVQDSIDVADYTAADGCQISYNPELRGRQNLKTTKYFVTDYLNFSGCIDLEVASHNSFMVLMNVGAACEVYCDGDKYLLDYGMTFLLPAALTYVKIKAQSDAKLLAIHL